MIELPLDALQWLEKVTADNRANGFDATDCLYQCWAYQAHDVGTTGDSTAIKRGAASIKARALVLAPPLDLFNPVQSAQELADEIPGAVMVEIPSAQGHQAASSVSTDDVQFLNEEIGDFLDTAARESGA